MSYLFSIFLVFRGITTVSLVWDREESNCVKLKDQFSYYMELCACLYGDSKNIFSNYFI